MREVVYKSNMTLGVRTHMGAQTPQPTTLFTIGYQGLTPESLTWVLKARGVRRLVDVRLRPFSRKPGFSRTSLSEYLAEHDIEYVHMPDLGNPPDIRNLYKAGAIEEGTRLFRARLRNGQSDAVDELVRLADGGNLALMCLEADYRICHRYVVADEAAMRSERGLEITHL